MAAIPNSGLQFEINGLQFRWGIVTDAYGDTVILARQKAPLSIEYDWVQQTQVFSDENTTLAQRIQRFEVALEAVNEYLAREYPAGGVTNPVTVTQQFDAWATGLMFDSTTNQIKRK